MKICFISRSAYPLFNPSCEATFGGAEVDLFLVAKELAKDKNYKTSFITGDFGQQSIEVYSDIDVYKSYKSIENKFLQIVKLIRCIIKIHADVYIQEGATGGTGIIALICKILGSKFIYRTASDIDCDGTFIKNHLIEGFFYRFGLVKADIIIVQNESNKEQLKKTTGLKSIVIRNGITIPKNTSLSKKTILWVARSEQLKQPFLFLEIAKEFPKESFIMICPEANYNSVSMPDLEKNASEISNLLFIPRVSFSEINTFYANSKIFINTSTYEGFPNTFVQSVINATPIFSLNVNPDAFLEKNKCGYCANGKMADMILNLKRVLNNPSIMQEMSQNAYFYAQKNHDISKIIVEYKNILINLK